MEKCLEHLIGYDNLNVAIGGFRKHIENSISNSSTKIHCFDKMQSIGTYQVSFFMQNGFELKTEIEVVVRRLFEGGFFVKWNEDNKRRRNYEIPYVPSVRMTIEHVCFTFAWTIGFGLTTSTLTLICELFVHRKMQQKGKLKFWTYIDWYLKEN